MQVLTMYKITRTCFSSRLFRLSIHWPGSKTWRSCRLEMNKYYAVSGIKKPIILKLNFKIVISGYSLCCIRFYIFSTSVFIWSLSFLVYLNMYSTLFIWRMAGVKTIRVAEQYEMYTYVATKIRTCMYWNITIIGTLLQYTYSFIGALEYKFQ